ncbi:MAG TPA: STAS domain-containing protein [Rhodocyclaceae bacterium]|nr:STAS domain-containing protein [Rhodocyclaceae bacterium]
MGTNNCLAIDRDLTIYHAIELKKELLDALAAGDQLDLDLSRVEEMDTAGLQLLILTKQEATQQGKALRIVQHSPAVREVIDFYNMAAHFGDPLVILANEAA